MVECLLPVKSPARCSSACSSAYLVSGRRSAVLLVADMRAPRRAVALLVDIDHREMAHEARRRGAVPVVLARLEEHAVARADHLDRRAAPLHEANAFRDGDRLSVRMEIGRAHV